MKSEDMKVKLDFYFKLQREIHITVGGGIFYNGRILDLNTNKDFVVFMDRKIGEVPILFEEIIKLEPYQQEDML